jgi:catechol 2,3-dioxygenase-like lactoylglutathione lyase family enzyme
VKFSQVRLLVDDFGEAFRFYRDELGLAPGFGAVAYVRDPSGNLIELFQAIPMDE